MNQLIAFLWCLVYECLYLLWGTLP